jgi:hypothetical protein
MRAFLRTWLDRRRRRREENQRKQAAIECALKAFRDGSGRIPMGALVLRTEADKIIVRVMFMNGVIPPARAWFAIADTGEVRELPYAEVVALEVKAWR